ncbi:DUF222 domain-containing protein [Cellulomonas sp. URHD0024]|uniref:DUF222 domain-containing protein n=1 Tax=Cellulomonas sp. URHD0024 TaxID=1302620 RepID=UPI0004057464|nr:DUF222 domain-containing protein [Cellulomonas sp. URHD0024]
MGEALRLAGRLTAIAAQTVAVVEADGWWALDARNRSITSWVAAEGRVTHGQASRLVGLGRAMRDDLPATATDAVCGAVSIEAAHVLASITTTTDARRAALTASAQECGEGFLLEHARVLPPAQLRLLARRWAAQADPEADERGYRDASEAEFLDLADTTNGCHLSGFLTTEHGHALRAALTALTERTATSAGQPAGRKRATALTTMVRTVLDNDLTGATGTHRPQISVVTDLESLTRALSRASEPSTGFGQRITAGDEQPPHAGNGRDGATGRETARESDDENAPSAAEGAWLSGQGVPSPGQGPPFFGEVAPFSGNDEPNFSRDDEPNSGDSEPLSNAGARLSRRPAPVGDVERFAVAELVGTGPIPDTVLARLACDSTVTRIVFGPESQVLNVGRAERTYTGHKRRAIIARDLHCQAPDCAAPPALSEIHHTEHWARDNGSTDVATGCLLCWAHHTWVHDHRITVRQSRGRWMFTDRHGQPVVGSG